MVQSSLLVVKPAYQMQSDISFGTSDISFGTSDLVLGTSDLSFGITYKALEQSLEFCTNS